jgi:hypothetical protein
MDWLGGSLDERALGFALATARSRAWRHSLALRATQPRFQPNLIGRIDSRVARVAERIRAAPFGLTALEPPGAEPVPVPVLIDRLA